MRLTTIIILAACLQSSANGLAQNTVTFSGKDVNLESVFSAIKKQTSYRFFFNTTIIQNASKVTIEVKNAPIEQVLNLALKDQSLTFAIKGRTIFVMKKPEEDKSSMVAPLQGDPVTVRGTVTDEQGNPLAGANVKVKGSDVGTTTDNQGRFTLANVDGNGMLEISFVGHETQLLPVKGKTMFIVALGQKIGTLDETVVIAYGTTTKRFTTGNVASVKARDIEKQPINNPLLALEGRVPGMFITQNSGVTGGGVTVRVQGVNSINNGNEPLYVIDGVVYPSLSIKGGFEYALVGGPNEANTPSPLSFINPTDIESIEVLKDADATSIYGSKAANGAIIITTMKGKSGRPKLDINLQRGIGKITRKLDILNTREYLDMRYEAYANDNVNWMLPSVSANDLKVWDTTRSTDWQDELIGGTAKYSNANASLSGGSSLIQYLLSGTYHRETSVFPGDFADQRSSIHFNLNSSPANQKFKFQFSSSYMYDNNKLPGVDLTLQAVRLEPVAPELYNSDGTLNWALDNTGTSTWSNPLASVLYQQYQSQTYNLISNLVIGYEIIPGLELKSSLGYNNLETNDFYSSPMISNKPESRASSSRGASYGSRKINSWIIEPQAIYKRSIGKGKFEMLVGCTAQQLKSNSVSLNGSGYVSDELLKDIKSATSITASSTLSAVSKYNAIFSRLNYNWGNKYIVNITGRRDGSSRFGEKNQFHNFASIGLGWIFSEEKIFQKAFHFLSFGKLRGSYGTTGNEQIGDYSFMSLYGQNSGIGVPYQNSMGLVPNNLPNPYLEWEVTKKLQFGIDLGFLQDRILLNSTFALNRSSNQLLSYVLPSFTGFSSITDNFPATVQNISWEFILTTINVKNKKINWSSNFNLTIPKNKVASFPNIENSSYASGTQGVIVGQPLGIKRAYNLLGVDLTSGKYQYADVAGNSTFAPISADRTILINTLPKYYGGFQNSIDYKSFHIDVLFQFVKQIGRLVLFNNGSSLGPGPFSSGSSNQPVTVLNRWQKQGDEKNIAKYTSNISSSVSSTTIVNGSNANYGDASFIRLKNVSVSWQLPGKWQKKIFAESVRIYVQGQNLITFTNYQGMDPENQSFASLPPLKMLTAGLQLRF